MVRKLLGILAAAFLVVAIVNGPLGIQTFGWVSSDGGLPPSTSGNRGTGSPDPGPPSSGLPAAATATVAITGLEPNDSSSTTHSVSGSTGSFGDAGTSTSTTSGNGQGSTTSIFDDSTTTQPHPTTTIAPGTTTTTKKPTTTTTKPKTTTTTKPPATTTTTTNPGNPGGCNAPAGAVQVPSGSSIQAAVDSRPGNTTFLLTGTYTKQTVRPKSGNQFYGCNATLDGQRSVTLAFGGSASNVLIDGVRVINYSQAATQYSTAPIDGGSGWTVRNSEVTNNQSGGIFARSGWTVSGNHVHHNGRIGVLANGNNIRITGNEINHNNTDRHDPYWEAGGTKFFNTTNLVVDNNRVHNNHGPGLWTDTVGGNTVYRNNRAYDNYGPGIFHEISCDALIEGNIVERNGNGFTGGMDGAGILVFSSPNVEIRNNTVRNNRHGIAGKHHTRGESSHCAKNLQNLYVHHNNVGNTGRTGVVVHNGDTAAYSSWNIRFDYNSYASSSGNNWEWAGGAKNWSQWRGYGHDAHGTAP